MCMRLCCEQPIICSISIVTWRPARGERNVERAFERPYTPNVALLVNCWRPDGAFSCLYYYRTCDPQEPRMTADSCMHYAESRSIE